MTQNSDRVEISSCESLRQSSPLLQRPVQSFLLTASIFACIFISWDFPTRPDGLRPAYAGVEIDLNLASKQELSLVPGIGPKLAERIIENRQRLGRFPTLDSLQRVYGIGPRTAERVATICVVEPDAMKVAARPQTVGSN